jgi:hypothetical protein
MSVRPELIVRGRPNGARVTSLIAEVLSPVYQRPPPSEEQQRTYWLRAVDYARVLWSRDRPAGLGAPCFVFRRGSWLAVTWAGVFTVLAMVVACGARGGTRCAGAPSCGACAMRLAAFLAVWLVPLSAAWLGRLPAAADYGALPPGVFVVSQPP